MKRKVDSIYDLDFTHSNQSQIHLAVQQSASNHPYLLCCLDQMLAVIELSQHLVSSSKTVRPIIPRGARCVGHVKIMWSAVCSLAPHSHFAEGAKPHLRMDKPKRPTQVRTRLSLIQAALVKLIPIGADPRNVDTER